MANRLGSLNPGRFNAAEDVAKLRPAGMRFGLTTNGALIACAGSVQSAATAGSPAIFVAMKAPPTTSATGALVVYTAATATSVNRAEN
jgi:hypothetical protein